MFISNGPTQSARGWTDWSTESGIGVAASTARSFASALTDSNKYVERRERRERAPLRLVDESVFGGMVTVAILAVGSWTIIFNYVLSFVFYLSYFSNSINNLR